MGRATACSDESSARVGKGGDERRDGEGMRHSRASAHNQSHSPKGHETKTRAQMTASPRSTAFATPHTPALALPRLDILYVRAPGTTKTTLAHVGNRTGCGVHRVKGGGGSKGADVALLSSPPPRIDWRAPLEPLRRSTRRLLLSRACLSLRLPIHPSFPSPPYELNLSLLSPTATRLKSFSRHPASHPLLRRVPGSWLLRPP